MANINTPQNLKGLIANTGKVSGSINNVSKASGKVNVGNSYMGSIIVDDFLSKESTNPVQNKIITVEVEAMKQKINDTETSIGNIDVLLGTI